MKTISNADIIVEDSKFLQFLLKEKKYFVLKFNNKGKMEITTSDADYPAIMSKIKELES